MTLYSKNGAYPAKLPFRITLSDGRTRTDPETFTAREIEDAGYTEAPAKPAGDVVTWNGTGWDVRDKTPEELAAEQAAADAANTLTRPRFAYLLALSGLEEVWKQIEIYAAENDRATYATVRAYSESSIYHLDKTLAVLETLKPITDQLAPEVDLSEPTIREAWEAAAQVEGF